MGAQKGRWEMKLTLLEINNYKKTRNVLIEPGERHLVLIAGKNMQGKTSVIGSMDAAMSGKKAVSDDPIRHGAKKASIRLVYEDPDLVVRRKFTKSGTTIEVTFNGKVIKSPQKMLDKLVGARFVDPMQFSRLSAKEQRDVLLGFVKLGIDLDENVATELTAYNERRDVNRDVKNLKSMVDGLPEAVEIPDEMVQDEILSHIGMVNKLVQEQVYTRGKILAAENAAEMAKSEVESAQLALRHARNEVDAAKGMLEVADARLGEVNELRELIVDDHGPELESLKNDLAHCQQHNIEVASLQKDAEAREKSEAALSEKEEESESLTQTIEVLKDLRTEALANAEMPIDGLTFDEDGLILNGAPFADASGAERLRASIAIAWALKPDLQDIWVTDGSLLDEDSLEMLREFAEEKDIRIWVERVGEHDEGAIIMHDGSVKS